MKIISNTVGIVSTNSCDFLRRCFQTLENNKSIVLLRSPDDRERIEKLNITNIIEPLKDNGWFCDKYIPGNDNDIAQISFTSGTEGPPKGVIIKHRAFNDVTSRLNEVMEVDSSISEYVGIPVNFSFGFGRCRAVAIAGGKSYIPANGFNPAEISLMASNGEINAISAVPSLWRIFLKSKSIFGDELEYIKWIEIGSQYMSANEKKELKELFPNAKIVQHYGLTEASRSTFLRINNVNERYLDSVGRAYGETNIKLSSDNKIMIKGPHVAEKLLIGTEYKDNTDKDGWLTTNDLGEIVDGYLYYKGRADDVINCGGIKLSPDTLETELLEKLHIKTGIAISRVDDDMLGEGILVAVNTDIDITDDAIINNCLGLLKKYGINNKNSLRLIRLDSFPQTSTGKVQRRKLREVYNEKRNNNVVDELDSVNDIHDVKVNSDPVIKEIIRVWKRVLKLEKIDINSNFYQQGGDSLSIIMALVELERANIPENIIKGMMQGKTIYEISQNIKGKSSELHESKSLDDHHLKTSMSINIIRGLFVLCVISAHWSFGLFEKLPSYFNAITPYLSPFFSAGTPGFSIIYGVSAGYSMFYIYNKNISRFKKIQKNTLIILGAGVIILALTRFYVQSIMQNETSFTDFTNSFYSVLTYYFLITASLGIWFKILNHTENKITSCFLLSSILFFVYIYFAKPLTLIESSGIIEFVKLVISAKYSYLSMLSGTLMGMSVGILLRRTDGDMSKIYAEIGASIVLFSFILMIASNKSHLWFVWPKEIMIWDWLFYFGMVLIFIYLLGVLLRYYNTSPSKFQIFYQFFAITGILAFPLFITHELVLPAKYIIEHYFNAGIYALLIPMLLFIGSSIYMYKKIYKVTFSQY